MRKILGLFVFIILFMPKVFSESFDDFSDVEKMWDDHTTVNVQDYDKVIEALEEKKEMREEKARRKKIKKMGGGSSLHKDITVKNEISEINDLKPDDDILLNVPVNLVIDGKLLEKGFYKAVGNSVDGKFYIEFYQSQFFKGKVEVNKTKDDFGEEDINFAKIIPYNDSFVKIIFGSLDFNAYSYIPFLL